MFTKKLSSTQTALISDAAPQHVIPGDFNGDGITDVAVPYIAGISGDRDVPTVFFLGNADGTFADRTTALYGVGSVPTAIFIARAVPGDFNNDGRTDILALNSGIDRAPFPGGQSQIFLSTPSGLADATPFLPQKLLFAHGGTAGDFNRDGNLDAVVFNSGSALTLLKGDGSGKLTEAADLAPKTAINGYEYGHNWGKLVDVDGNGYVDLIAGTWELAEPAASAVYLNDGKGSFANAARIDLPKTAVIRENILYMEVTDLNGDYLPDLVLSVTNGGDPSIFYRSAYLQFLVDDGTGHFRDETSSRLAGQSTAPGNAQNWYKYVESVDLNGDGALDLLAQRWTATGVTNDILVNDGSGPFTTIENAFSGVSNVIGDVSGNGSNDFVVADWPNGLTVLENDLPQVTSRKGQIYFGTPDDDRIKGSAGADTLVVAGARTEYKLTIGADRAVIDGVEGHDTLFGVERLKFKDGLVAVDLAGNAGQAYRLYQAALDRTPDKSGLGFWIRELDRGVGDLNWMAASFIASDEFKAKYGTPATVTNQAFLNLIYQNVLDRGPDAGGLSYWLGELERGFAREKVLAGFSESAENQANVAAAISDGIWYV